MKLLEQTFYIPKNGYVYNENPITAKSIHLSLNGPKSKCIINGFATLKARRTFFLSNYIFTIPTSIISEITVRMHLHHCK